MSVAEKGWILVKRTWPPSPVPHLEQVQALQGVKEVKSLPWV